MSDRNEMNVEPPSDCDPVKGCPPDTHNIHCGYPDCAKGRAVRDAKSVSACPACGTADGRIRPYTVCLNPWHSRPAMNVEPAGLVDKLRIMATEAEKAFEARSFRRGAEVLCTEAADRITALEAEVERTRSVAVQQDIDVRQALGSALGYDEREMAEQVAESMAAEAATKLAEMEAENASLRALLGQAGEALLECIDAIACGTVYDEHGEPSYYNGSMDALRDCVARASAVRVAIKGGEDG